MQFSLSILNVDDKRMREKEKEGERERKGGKKMEAGGGHQRATKGLGGPPRPRGLRVLCERQLKAR